MFGSRVVLLRKQLNTVQLEGEMRNYSLFVKDSRRLVNNSTSRRSDRQLFWYCLRSPAANAPECARGARNKISND
jgi:hypothetical protein